VLSEKEQLLWKRINDLEDGIGLALEAAEKFVSARPEDLDYTEGEKELLESLAWLGELVGFGEEGP
jgi:hypothetical protein